jgi:hypothetical protein
MNKRNGNKLIVALIAVMMLLSLAACGASGGSGDQTSESGAGDFGYTDDMGGDGAYSEDSDTAVPRTDPQELQMKSDQSAVVADSAPLASGDGGSNVSTTPADSNRKITFSASFTIETKNYNQDYTAINALVGKANGYIASEDSYTPPSYESRTEPRSSYFSLRIPIGKYDTFMTDIEGVGEVVNKNKSSEDLTAQYFDTESRIKLLEMRRDRLVDYIKKAVKPADIIQFESELSDVLYQLDQYQGEKRGLDQLIDYATIDVTLNELITPETIGQDGKPLGERAGNAFTMSIQNVKIFFGDATVFLAGALPVLVILVILAAIIWLIVRRARRQHKKRKDAAIRLQEPKN